MLTHDGPLINVTFSSALSSVEGLVQVASLLGSSSTCHYQLHI